MTINERIKLLRKEKGLNQKQFASLLGVTQSGASYMEQPGNNISESSIKSICTICNVNEDWLRNGIEPMYVESDTSLLDDFVKQRGATELEMQIIKSYFNLDPKIRKIVIEHFREILSISSPATIEREKTVDELEAEYKKSVLNSALKTESSATSTTSDIEDQKAANND